MPSQPEIALPLPVSGSPDRLARQRRRDLAAVENGDAVYEDVIDSRGNLLRNLVGRVVYYRVGVENGDVRVHARAQKTPVFDADSLGRQRRHFSNRELERDD